MHMHIPRGGRSGGRNRCQLLRLRKPRPAHMGMVLPSLRPAADCRPRLLLCLVRKVRRNPRRRYSLPKLAPERVRRERRCGMKDRTTLAIAPTPQKPPPSRWQTSAQPNASLKPAIGSRSGQRKRTESTAGCEGLMHQTAHLPVRYWAANRGRK